MTFAWTPELIEHAAAMWTSGTHSATQIAAAIGTSRGSVIGKMDRAGVRSPRTKADNAPPRPRAERKPVERKGPAKAMKPVAAVPAPASLPAPTLHLVSVGKTIIALGVDECRYPLLEVAGTHRFCAAPTAHGESYCPACRALVYDNRQRPFGHRLPVRRFR
jgi:hypothetical protein